VLDLKSNKSIQFHSNQVKRIEENCKVNKTLYYINDTTGDVDHVDVDIFSIDSSVKVTKD